MFVFTATTVRIQQAAGRRPDHLLGDSARQGRTDDAGGDRAHRSDRHFDQRQSENLSTVQPRRVRRCGVRGDVRQPCDAGRRLHGGHVDPEELVGPAVGRRRLHAHPEGEEHVRTGQLCGVREDLDSEEVGGGEKREKGANCLCNKKY